MSVLFASSITSRPPHAEGAALVSTDGARAFPLERAHLEARAQGGMACSTLRQHFRNPHDEALEVEYILPLPADGAVLGYRVTVGERVIRGEIRTREAARKAYREALYQGKTAGLLEQERADTFRQQLGNIPGGTAVEVEIEILHPLAFRAGVGAAMGVQEDAQPAGSLPPGGAEGGAGGGAEWEYRFPTTVGVRYMGEAGRVPDAHHLSPDRADPSTGGTPARLTLALQVAGVPAGARLRAPGHALVVSGDAEPSGREGVSGTEGVSHAKNVSAETSAGRAAGSRSGSRHARGTAADPATATLTATLAEPARLDRDLVVRWEALTPELGVHLVEGAGLEGDEGRNALVTVLPPEIPHTVFARDLTVLLDTSGSMHGLPLALGKAVVERLLRSLGPDDRFEILTFGSTVSRFFPATVAASPGAVGDAVRRLREIQASGATEMRSAVAEALRPLRSGAQRQVVLVTDGYIGFEGAVVAEAMTRLPEGVRFHAVGVGASPNRTLTGGLARAGRGLELFAQCEASAREAGVLLLAATARPVLTELAVQGSALAQAPARPRDVAAGHPVVLTLELRPEGGTLELTGRVPGSREPWRWTTRIPAGSSPMGSGPFAREPSGLPWSPLPLGALHGREQVADLELLEAAGTPRAGIDARIEATALRHRIVSRRTSLVAVSDTPTVDPGEPTRHTRVPVELPVGVSAEMVGLAHPSGAPGGRFESRVEAFGLASYPGLAPRGRRKMAASLDDISLDDISLGEGPAAPEGAPSFEEDMEGPVFGRAPDPTARPDRTLRSDRGDRGPDAPVEMGRARVLRADGADLVLEVEVPFDGWVLPAPGHEVVVTRADGNLLRARVSPTGSTRRGPHPAGTRVRLALRLGGHGSWPAGELLRLAWVGARQTAGDAAPHEGMFQLTMILEETG